VISARKARWVKTSLDGLGRTIRVERGHGSTVVSITDTEYAPCACSPVKRVKRVSMPYAPGGTVSWTEYEFDARGRTTKVMPPGNMGFTSYVYEGSTVRVIEPGGPSRETLRPGAAVAAGKFCVWSARRSVSVRRHHHRPTDHASPARSVAASEECVRCGPFRAPCRSNLSPRLRRKLRSQLLLCLPLPGLYGCRNMSGV
jgi:hypothetical protein